MSVGNLTVVLELDGADQFITTINRASTSVTGLTANIQNNISITNQAANAHQSVTSSLGGMVLVLGQAAAAFNLLKDASTQWVQSIVQANAKMESLMLLLKGISSATDEIGRTNEALTNFNYLIDKASSSPFALNKLTDAFVKLKGAGIEPVERTLNSVVDAVAHFGGNDQTLDRVALALQQMAGKGVVSMEELRRQLGDAVPGAMKAMAQSMNLTMGQLIAAVGKGTLESKNAIAQMTAEFDRLYGGSAAQKLDSFNGQMSVLNTNFQKLALVAGGMGTDGKYGEGSFFKNITENMKEFNGYLRSTEVSAFAVTINRALNEVVNGVVNVIKFFHDWGGVITNVGVTILQFVVVTKALSAAMSFAEAAQSNATILNIITNLRNLGTIGGAALSTLAQGISSYVAWTGSLLASSAAGATAIGGLEAAAVGLVMPLTALAVQMALIAVPAAAIAGLGYLIFKLMEVENRGNLAADAIKRIGQGDLTRSNEADARKEIDAINQRVAALQALKDSLDKVKNTGKGVVDTKGYGSVLGTEGVKAPEEEIAYSGQTAPLRITPKNANENPAVQYYNSVVSTLNELKANLEQAVNNLDSVSDRRIKQAADNDFDALNKKIEASLAPTLNKYRAKMDAINEARKELGGKIDTESLNKGADLNSQAAETRADRYKPELDLIDTYIQASREKLTAGLTQEDRDANSRIDATVAKLQTRRDEIVAIAADAAINAGKVVVNDNAKEIAQRVKQAQDYMASMTAKIAANEAEAMGANASLAKMVAYLDKAGKWAGISDEAKASLLELAQQLANSEDKLKSFKEATKAEQQIDMGLDKANADLARYSALITDPMATEGKRTFEMLTLQMQRAIVTLNSAFLAGAISGQEFENQINRTNQALRAGAAAANMSDVQRLSAAAHDKWVASLPAGTRFIQQQSDALGKMRETRAKLADDLNNKAITPEAFKSASDALDQGERDTNNTKDNRVARAGAGAARAANNEVTQMTGRVAQLRAQIEGSRGELAKWNAELDRGKYAGQATAIRALAAEEDRLAEALKKINVAKQAEETLKTGLADSTAAAADLKAVNDAADGRGKLIGVERELFDLRRRNNKEVIRVGQAPAVAGTAYTEEARINRIAAAQKMANDKTAEDASLLARKAMDDNKTEAETINKSVETSLEKRRAAGQREVSDFEASQRQVIAAAAVTAAERTKMEDQLAQTITAKRMQVDRQTENGLEKWMRESMDMSTQISNFGASAFSQVTDALTTMATTGKFSFTDLASWAIKELTRITLSSAFASLIKATGLMGSGGAGGGINFASIIGAVAGQFTGVASGATGYDSFGNVGAGFAGPPAPGGVQFHSGGMVGSEGASRSFNFNIPEMPRFHTGAYLKSDEQAAVLQNGEAVFTAGQLGAIGQMNHSYGQVEGQMAAMASAMVGVASQPRIPSSFGPAQNMNPTNTMGSQGTSGGAGPPVTVNMHNQSGSDLNATAAAPRFDGEQYVVDIVMKHANKPGPLRNSLASMSK